MTTTNVASNRIDPDLLRIMQCPVGRAPLVQVGDWLFSKDAETRRKYPIREGIPIMLIEESLECDRAEFDWAMSEANRSDRGPS